MCRWRRPIGGELLFLVGAVLYLGSWAVHLTSPDRDTAAPAVALGLGSLGPSIAGQVSHRRARKGLSCASGWYNSALPDAEDDGAGDGEPGSGSAGQPQSLPALGAVEPAIRRGAPLNARLEEPDRYRPPEQHEGP